MEKKNIFANYFAEWNKFELILLTLAIVAPLTLGVIFGSSLLQIGASSITVMAALLFAKARIEGYLISVIGLILFGVVAFNNSLYGEVGVIIFFGFPAQIAGFISWFKALKKGEKDKPATIRIRKTSIKELLLLALLCSLLGIGIYKTFPRKPHPSWVGMNRKGLDYKNDFSYNATMFFDNWIYAVSASIPLPCKISKVSQVACSTLWHPQGKRYTA